MTQTLILIPARMASTRLPGKPLALINGLPMICHVVDRAREAEIGEPVVATDSQGILEVVESHGAKAVMTREDHESGSDRIWEAVEAIDPNAEAEIIINVQGDLPTIEAQVIRQSVLPLENSEVDIATLATEITVEEERTNPNVVKAIGTPIGENRLRALYFSRATAPHGNGPLYHHIGLYAYRRSALEKFVSLPPSTLEQREKLEQLRALENGMRIDIQLVDSVPLGVDTPEDLGRAQRVLSEMNS
ncbi:MAG: 3-deoxy-manno-octulosonate cytidylyltransferase [Rhizobiaceae bacterium]|nr:3-deoxy-manno-octulosonate cytidylyltransferase [Rhizobiaceae bacterium]